MFWCFSTTLKDAVTSLAPFPCHSCRVRARSSLHKALPFPRSGCPEFCNPAASRAQLLPELGQQHIPGGRGAAGRDLQLWDVQTPPANPTCPCQMCSLPPLTWALLQPPLCAGGALSSPQTLTFLCSQGRNSVFLHTLQISHYSKAESPAILPKKPSSRVYPAGCGAAPSPKEQTPARLEQQTKPWQRSPSSCCSISSALPSPGAPGDSQIPNFPPLPLPSRTDLAAKGFQPLLGKEK